MIQTFNWHTQKGTAIALNHDGTRLASSADDKTTVVWDVAEANVLLSLTTLYPVSSLTLNKSGAKLGILVDNSGSSTDSVLIWDVDSRILVAPEMQQPFLVQDIGSILE